MEHKTKRPKSPNYPAFNLETAVNKARILYEKDGKTGAPIDVAMKHINLKSPKSGTALRTISALRQFKLIDKTKDRIIVTDKALDLLIYPKSDERYIKALEVIALNPTSYGDLYERYNQGLPSDEVMKAELIRDCNFNPKIVDSFIDNFKQTIEFAGLSDMRKIEDEVMQENVSDVAISPTPIKKTMKISGTPVIDNPTFATKHYPIPLSKGKTAIIAFEELPIEKEDLENIKKWLDLFAGTLTEVQ